MAGQAIYDTGPLVAYFDRRERHHVRAVSHLDTLLPPQLVNEPVLMEALFPLRGYSAVVDALMDLVERGVLRVRFNIGEQIADDRAPMLWPSIPVRRRSL